MPRARGGAALAVALTMALVLSLLAAHAHHTLLTEQRLSANHRRATAAFDAAEAGIDWMLARLNGVDIPADCATPLSTRAGSFRQRHVGLPDATGRWQPPAASAQCRADGARWRCACGVESAGAATPRGVDDTGSSTPTFTVQALAAESPRLVTLSAVGCADSAAVCGASGRHDGAAHVRVDLGLLPAVAPLPSAPLTVRGQVLGAARWTVRNGAGPGTGRGVAVQSGGPVAPGSVLASALPGTPASAAVASGDAALRQLSPDGLFASLFRMDKPSWQALPTVRRLDCASPCDAGLQSAVIQGVRQFWLAGGLNLVQPATLGSPDRPVVLVVNGPVRLAAGTRVHGVVYTTSSQWHGDDMTHIVGAVVAEGDLGGGPVTLQHDAEVADALQRRTGTFVRVAGSWRDF